MVNQLGDLINVVAEELSTLEQMKAIQIKFEEVKKQIYEIKGYVELKKYNIK